MKNRIFALIKNEFIHLTRDFRSLTLMIFIPLLLIIIFGFAVSFDVKNLALAYNDKDKTKTSQDFINKFTNSEYFKKSIQTESIEESKELLDSGRAKIILNIPKGFEKNIKSGKTTQIQILVDGSEPNIATATATYASTIAQEYSKDILIKTLKSNPKISQKLDLNFGIKTRVLYNPELRSLNFYVPGLICIILMMTSASLTSLSIISEREKGTIEGIIASPISSLEFMIGKITPYIIIALVDVLLVVLASVLIFHIPFKGSILFMGISSFIFLVGALGIGILISVTSRTAQEAMMISNLITMLPTIFLSDFIFPLDNIPYILQIISYAIPARYFLKIIRGIFLKGVGFDFLWWQFLMLTIFSILIISMASIQFKKRIDND